LFFEDALQMLFNSAMNNLLDKLNKKLRKIITDFYLTFPKNDDIIIKLSNESGTVGNVFGLRNTSLQKFSEKVLKNA